MRSQPLQQPVQPIQTLKSRACCYSQLFLVFYVSQTKKMGGPLHVVQTEKSKRHGLKGRPAALR
jgi:hypothetical protein